MNNAKRRHETKRALIAWALGQITREEVKERLLALGDHAKVLVYPKNSQTIYKKGSSWPWCRVENGKLNGDAEPNARTAQRLALDLWSDP